MHQIKHTVPPSTDRSGGVENIPKQAHNITPSTVPLLLDTDFVIVYTIAIRVSWKHGQGCRNLCVFGGLSGLISNSPYICRCCKFIYS
ncbi:hypothetical protein PAHAL_2G189900 [Panicum hallii]|uniref:Uncharacterized protein n=1 Tax=Panicum hallii TaxID=206008 RepID=A0A2S3GYQ5_9POAL|nr:hypothetical protein PAHAL_2G189900 [Panicum hallii]